MTARKFLESYLDANSTINAKLDQIRCLKELATRTTQIFTDEKMLTTAAIVSDMVDLDNDINADIEAVLALRHQVEGTIQGLPSRRCRDVLHLRYIEDKKWEVIADELHYTERNVYYLHNKGLELIEEMLA
jgi:DNA-directed RNA polymerase specialized sigma24 family protein